MEQEAAVQKPHEMRRSSGILLHITSLPGPYGVGTLGQSARDFADFLSAAGQTWWQMLPLGPTGYGDSPYQSFSTFAGNPYLIDLDRLIEAGLLQRPEVQPLDLDQDPQRVNFARLYRERFKVLHKAFSRFSQDEGAYQKFCREEAFWLEDYALFMALKDAHRGAAWQHWSYAYKYRDVAALQQFRAEHSGELAFYQFLQYLFFTQWQALQEDLHQRGLLTIGDLPFYVAEDSADTWAHPELFMLDDERNSIFVGGCPPDAFTVDGQLWGNPCYKWERHEADDFVWWTQRIAWQLSIFDRIRIDHFRGFESFWQIPAGDPTARNGLWVKGPGLPFFEKLREKLGDLPIIAEDLGYMTPEVRALQEATGYPGMNVLQFAFGPELDSEHLPHRISRHRVVYTGTHDNDTVLGWLATASLEEVQNAQGYLGLSETEGLPWGMMRGAMTSAANLAILQMQDLLGLDNRARMNRPGDLGGNWVWRMQKDVLTAELTARLRELTRLSGRLNPAS